MLTLKKYHNFLACLYTLDNNYMYPDDYSVYANNHAKYNRIQFMVCDHPCLKELKDTWNDLRKEKDNEAREIIKANLKEIEGRITDRILDCI